VIVGHNYTEVAAFLEDTDAPVVDLTVNVHGLQRERTVGA
jgi:hypothetical protein